MKQKKNTLRVTIHAAALAALALPGCRTTGPPDPVTELREVIAPALGLDFKGEVSEGTERNFTGLRSEDLLLSRRSDSRTFFVQNEAFGVARPGGIFQGSDEELLDKARKIGETLGLPPGEILEASVIQVQSRVASVDPATQVVSMEEAERAERYAHLVRAVKGIPVFTSRLLLALDRAGDIGYLELHWPEVPSAVLAQATELQAVVEKGWQPPTLEGARAEEVEAGVVHSQAVGFLMEVRPVIRVIYSPVDPSIGRKPMLYLDAAGRPVELPRDLERVDPPPDDKREPGEVEQAKPPD